MIKKCLGLIVGLLLLTGCSQLATLSVLGSTASFAVSNNTFSKIYSSTDVLTFMATDKDIKTHVYETVTSVKKKVNETFTLEKPEMLTKEKKVLVAVPVIKVEVSEIFRPDNNLLLASVSTPLVVEKIWTTKEWNIYSVLLIGLVLSNLIFLSSLIYLVIYFLTSTQIDIKLKKRKIKND